MMLSFYVVITNVQFPRIYIHNYVSGMKHIRPDGRNVNGYSVVGDLERNDMLCIT